MYNRETFTHTIMRRRLYYDDMVREYEGAEALQEQLETVFAYVRNYCMVLRYFESAHNTYSDLTCVSQNTSGPGELRIRPEYSIR